MLISFQTQKSILKFQKEKFLEDKKEKKIANNNESDSFLEGLPKYITTSLLNCNNLFEINKLMQVNKKWHRIIDSNKDILWTKLIKKFHFPSLNTKEAINDIIQSSKNHIKMIFVDRFRYHFPTGTIKLSLQYELDELLANMQLKNVCKLQEICKARDVLMVWETLQKHTNQHVSNLDIQNFNSVKELIDKAKEFSNWCFVNQLNLSLLQELDLIHKHLTFLPAEIGLLANLRKLNLCGNELNSLPHEIGQLENLEFLNLNVNQLTSTGFAEIRRLKKLKKLYLVSNQLNSVPDQICDLINLEILHLSSNPLTSLPTNIGKLTSLKQINLEGIAKNIFLPEILKSNNVKVVLDSSRLHFLSDESSEKKDENLLSSNLLTFLPSRCAIQ